MNVYVPFQNSNVFAQAYGTDTYGAQQYSCQNGQTSCTTTETAPNTGFLGMSQDAVIASAAGALLVAVAIIGTVFVIVSRRRAKKHPKE